MDLAVLTVQLWVNETYRGRTGFNPAPETGETGWSTMYALTRALQIELGISIPVDNFGPGTQAAYKAWGEMEIGKVPTDEKGQRIVKILQGAMYCKGYNPTGFTGTFGEGTKSAVIKLQTDAGLPIRDGKVYAYVFKAFLTMDAYVLTYGGDPRIREMQRDLNYKYYTTSGVQPADGHYQRGTNRALIYGIQTEEGISPSQQTGSVGPTTKSLLPTLDIGSTKINFVKLFQYAMYVNRFDPGTFDGVYDSEVKNTVARFQEFVMLPATGVADMSTWLSLLQSSGDPNRKGTACDCITEVTPARAQALKDAGYETVGRYLTNAEGSSLNKKIQPGEIQTILNAGLTIFPIYQTYGGEANYFNESQGKIDAEAAYQAARDYGFKKDTIIYFAVDFDALGYHISDNILPHFKGINEKMLNLGGSYRVGIYGPRSVCSSVSEKGLAVTSFVSGMSNGFSGNLGYPLPTNWAFDQISTVTVGSGEGSIQIDNNIKSGRDQGVSSVGDISGINDEFFKQLAKITLLAYQYTENGSDPWDPNYLVTNYYRHKNYYDTKWTILSGEINEEFKSFVNSSLGEQEFINIIDPITRMEIGIEHLMATLSALLYANYPIIELHVKDFAGWAGDLIQVMKDIQENKGKYNGDVYKCALDYIGTPTSPTFSFDDYAGDVDAINIAKIWEEGNNETIYNVFFDYYQSDVLTRSSRFYKNRFGGSKEILNDQVWEYVNGVDFDLANMRFELMEAFNVPAYTVQDGDALVKAFVDTILNNVEKETI